MDKMRINYTEGINSNYFDIYIANDIEGTYFHQTYTFGYNCSWSKEKAEYSFRDHEKAIKYGWSGADTWYAYKPYIVDIITELCHKANIDIENIELTGKNVFAGSDLSEAELNCIKDRYILGKE